MSDNSALCRWETMKCLWSHSGRSSNKQMALVYPCSGYPVSRSELFCIVFINLFYCAYSRCERAQNSSNKECINKAKNKKQPKDNPLRPIISNVGLLNDCEEVDSASQDICTVLLEKKKRKSIA